LIVVRHNYISARDRQSRGKGKPPKLAAVGRALAHVKYIQHRPGEDREPGGREFFNEDEEGLDSKRLRAAVRGMRDAKVVVHKITLAPEINPDDKKQFTREVMQQLGQEKGLDLQWFAVKHDNTDHHHIHVVVLGKDKNGTDVRIDKKDYDKIKDYGDRYLERCHPLELERSREERERKERDRLDARKKEKEAEREQRIRDGLELPFIHKKIIREMNEPYEQWKKTPAGEKENQSGDKTEKPYFQDTIEAAGKEWSKQNTLEELKELDEYLWENYDERLEKDEYRKLVAWIKEKERFAERKNEKDGADRKEKQKDEFEYKGQKYSKNSSHEKLMELSQKLRENKNKKDRLPIDDHNKLREWIEDKDRAKWAGVLQKQMDIAKTKDWQAKARAGQPDNYRYIDPVQQEVTSMKAFGLWMKFANLANQVVKAIPLDDRNRDFNKEAIQELDETKKDINKRAIDKGETGGGQAQDTINKLDKEIDQKLDERKEQERKRREQKKKNPFERDPWGRY
jgi:hypothetical protein